jgi:acyl dehydratase
VAGPTRRLRGAPGAATLYPRAVVGSLPLVHRLPLVGRGGGDGLPDLTLELPDLRLDPARVAGYARVCGFGLRDALPATYLHVLAFPLSMALMTDGAFPFGVLGLVHVANRIDHHRPVGLGEAPSLRVHAEALRAHPKGRQFDIVAEATVDGERVWEGRSTYLRRGGGGGGSGGSATSGAARPRAYAAADAAEPPAAEAVWSVPDDIGRRYGAVSGDRNPIHLHALTARLLGQSRAIAHGMWLKARCVAALDPALPDAFAVEVRFKRPVTLPAKVGFSSVAAPGGRRFAVHDAQRGVPHLEGRIGT